ncbi:MAG: hypothetical protein IPN29_22135 [Saprospiraceae bacterium]|nr:hypothetical protein [Saprospiraceae bacterium]
MKGDAGGSAVLTANLKFGPQMGTERRLYLNPNGFPSPAHSMASGIKSSRTGNCRHEGWKRFY